MNNTLKTILIWIFAILLTLVTAVYQRLTGPSYPVRGTAEIGGQEVKYRLIRTWDGSDDARVTILIPDTAVRGEIKLRRFKSLDSWSVAPMTRSGDTLVGLLPHQPPAGKIMYEVFLTRGDQRVQLNEHPAVLRYKGFVPGFILIPHIFFMFFAMVLSAVTGLTALFRGRHTYIYAWLTTVFIIIGGLILGPIVQKYAFDAYWNGWPFGHDLTDNKSLVAFLFWAGALWAMHKNRENRLWPIVAAVVLLIVFLIPHSMLGSEIDHTKSTHLTPMTPSPEGEGEPA